MTDNVLYYGDNLDILRRYVKDETIDLIYLDPPFKSDQDYNILFAERNGSKAAAQIKAFDDTWHWFLRRRTRRSWKPERRRWHRPCVRFARSFAIAI